MLEKESTLTIPRVPPGSGVNYQIEVRMSSSSIKGATDQRVKLTYALLGVNADKNKPDLGRAHGRLNLPNTITYEVNTQSRRVVRMTNYKTFFEDEGDSYPIQEMNYRLCRYESPSSGVEDLCQ